MKVTSNFLSTNMAPLSLGTYKSAKEVEKWIWWEKRETTEKSNHS